MTPRVVDKQAKRSLLPIIHSTFGVGMMVAAGLSGWMLSNDVNLQTNYALVAAVVLAIAIWGGLNLPKRPWSRQDIAKENENKAIARTVWREPRTLVVALIGLSFIIAELSAGTWLPIALENAGFTPADAANAFGLFWVVITATRVLGGFVVDQLGRFWTILLSTLVTSTGILIFIFDSFVSQPYLGIILWGAGLALGFPMAANALSGLIGRQTVTCEKKDVDRYKRIVAVCTVGGQDVGGYLVAKGLAVAYVHYSNAYVPAETAARAGGLGLWAGTFDMPWDWRKAH